MKKFFVCALLVAATIAVALLCLPSSPKADAYLRVHIRANSNGEKDQAVKYLVKDEAVKYLTPVVAGCETKDEAMKMIEKELPALERLAERVLSEKGFSYGARASLRQEEFPTRVYEEVTLGAGVYDALILELGTGEGDNWWCVVYPPLCFSAGNGNVVYKSKIAEIINSFFGR